jgi:hypothetical protein
MGLPRYKLKPGTTLATTLRQYERSVNRTVGFSDTSCWMFDGNAKIGWRHASCVGTYNYAGASYRFKVTTTPLSCSKEREVLTVPGVKTWRTTRAWKHKVFDCAQGRS